MNNKQSGFTLLELMVTVAIVGIIASIALWNSSDMLEENRAENFLLELKRNISYARAQAASTDEIVIICPVPSTATGSSSNLECKNEWGPTSVIILFIDKNNNGKYNNDTDSLLRMMSEPLSNDKIKYSGNIDRLRFNTSGRITTEPGNIIYCPNTDNENNKALSVAQSGTAFYLGDFMLTCE
ncbi:GspH/FimT family pseudopilin [Pseudoalteromonas carrageenovora]|uniref:GspH/FimT family pseudopilin n=1 Tax=Pseudoalteromonas carrageenovora TaxID=227 RepID=UPI002FD3FC4B